MSNILGQYFTEERFSNLLISSINLETPSTILELGIGEGSLAIAAMNRWRSARFIATEVDLDKIVSIKEKLPYVSVSNIDGLSSNIEEQLNIIAGGIDIAVCNPPYKIIAKEESYLNILKSAGFLNSCNLNKLTTDILFLSQNIKMLKDDGELGIILPDTILTGSEFELFRKDLLSATTITGLIQLPMCAFAKTEARTHILFLKKRRTQEYTTELKLSNINGKIISKISVDSNSLLTRMDYTYHSFLKRGAQSGVSLKDIGAKIFRGNLSKKELLMKLGAGNFFHTTSFKNNCCEAVSFSNRGTIANFVREGDILVARVGKGSVGKVAIVKSGVSEISDCILAIRVEKKFQKQVYESLKSEYGQSWLFAHSHGVCSRFVTKSDLINYVFLKL